MSATSATYNPNTFAKRERRNKILYRSVWGLLSIINVMLVVISIFIPFNITTPSLLARSTNISVMWLVTLAYTGLFVALFVASIKQVQPNESATLVFMGRPLFNVPSGPSLVLPFFTWLVFSPKKRLQREYPTDTEFIWRDSSETMPRDGVWMEPYRVPTGGKDKLSESDSALDARLTLDISFFIAYRINQPDRYVSVVGMADELNEDDTKSGRQIVDIDEGFRQLQDTAKRVINSTFGKMSPREIVEQQTEIASKLADTLDTLVRDREGWGVDLDEVALTSIDLSHTINNAMKSVPAARFNAEKVIADGMGAARVVFLTGEQEAAVKKLKLQAEAEGLSSIAKQLGLSESSISTLINAKLAESAVGAVGEKGKLVIVGSGGVQNVLGLIEGLKGE